MPLPSLSDSEGDDTEAEISAVRNRIVNTARAIRLAPARGTAWLAELWKTLANDFPVSARVVLMPGVAREVVLALYAATSQEPLAAPRDKAAARLVHALVTMRADFAAPGGFLCETLHAIDGFDAWLYRGMQRGLLHYRWAWRYAKRVVCDARRQRTSVTRVAAMVAQVNHDVLPSLLDMQWDETQPCTSSAMPSASDTLGRQ